MKTHGKISREVTNWHAYAMLDRKAVVTLGALGKITCTIKICLGRVHLEGWVDAANSDSALKISSAIAARFDLKHLGMFATDGDFSHAPFDTRIDPRYGKVEGYRNVYRTETIEECHARVCKALCMREEIAA